MSSFQNVSNDYVSIGKSYRENFGGNPFGIKSFDPVSNCRFDKECDRTYDSNVCQWSGTCKGSCIVE